MFQETCFCGRTGSIEDREPILTARGERALRCPRCGYLDRLDRLDPETRRRVFNAAGRAPSARRLTA